MRNFQIWRIEIYIYVINLGQVESYFAALKHIHIVSANEFRNIMPNLLSLRSQLLQFASFWKSASGWYWVRPFLKINACIMHEPRIRKEGCFVNASTRALSSWNPNPQSEPYILISKYSNSLVQTAPWGRATTFVAARQSGAHHRLPPSGEGSRTVWATPTLSLN